MDNSDSPKFAKVMIMLCETFDRAPSATLTDIYFESLAEFPIEQVERAAALTIQSCRFFPKPVELRERIEGSTDDRAQKAWTLLLEANRVAGYYTSIWVEDPCLARAIMDTFGGWIQATESLSHLSDAMIASKRKEFLSNYRLAMRRPVSQAINYLMGMHEASNRSTVSSWSRGRFPQCHIMQSLGVVSDEKVTLVRVAYDAYTAALTEDSRHMLEQGGYRHLLAAKTDQSKLRAVERKKLPCVANVDLQTAIEHCEDELEREKLQVLQGSLGRSGSNRTDGSRMTGMVRVGNRSRAGAATRPNG